MSQRVSSSSNSRTLQQAGFSLIEMAIVLVILGIIGGMSLPLLTAHMTRTALIKTRAHQDYAFYALAAYVERHRRFPCPADPKSTGADFGLAQAHCRGHRAKGILPFKTLGISEIYARDGFKRLMTYAVDQELTKRDADIYREQGGQLIVKNEQGESVLAPPLKEDKNPNYIALILLSYGESGVGAYIGNGQSTKIMGETAPSHKRENIDDNFTFIESSQTDGILRWESRDQFLKYYVKEK